MEEDPEDDLELVQNRIPWTDPGMESSAEETHPCPARSRERGPPQKPRPSRGPRGRACDPCPKCGQPCMAHCAQSRTAHCDAHCSHGLPGMQIHEWESKGRLMNREVAKELKGPMGPCRHEDQSGLQKVQDLTAETHPVAVCALTREELEDVLDTPHARAVEALKNKGEEMDYDKGYEKWLGDGKSQGMEMGFKKGSESRYDRGYEKGKGKRMDIMGFEKDLLALDQALLQAGVSTYRDDPCRPRLSFRGGSGPGLLRRVPPAPTVAVMDKVYSLAPAISARRSLWVRRQPL